MYQENQNDLQFGTLEHKEYQISLTLFRSRIYFATLYASNGRSLATSNFGEMVQVAEYSLATWETEALVRQQSLLPRLWDKPTPRTPTSYYRTPKEKYDIPGPRLDCEKIST